MAGIEDALKFLDPKYINKAKEILSDPMGSGAGIMDAIKDFDPIEAANFVKDKVLETTFGEANVDDMIIGGGVGGQSTELPGILAQAGDYALDQAGLPINVSTLSDIGSAFSDQGTAGVMEVAKNQAVDLIKQGFVNEGIALATQANIPVATILALANNKITGPIVRGAGNEFANLGFDLASNVPFFGNQLGTMYDTGLNLFGKKIGQDFYEGKVTLPIILIYQQGNINEKKYIKNLFQKKERSSEEFNNILNIISKYKIINQCYKKAEYFINLSSNSLSIFPDSEEKRVLENLTTFSLERSF